MNSRVLSVLLLLIVAIGFSGVASAATMQKLVSAEIPAWDELITPAQDAWNETISEAIAAYDEEVSYRDLYIVQGPNELQDWLDFIYSHEGAIGGMGRWTYFPEVSHIEQVVDVPEHIETVVDVPEHYESQLVSEAYDETVTDVPAHYESQEADHDGYSLYGNGEYMRTGNHGLKIYAKFHQGETLHGFVSVPVGNSNPCQSKDWKWIPVTEQVYVPAVTHVEHHDAVYEDVLIPATYKDIVVPATYKDVKVVDEVAHYLVRGAYTIHHPAVDAVIVEHPAVDAVYVHHPAIPAVYETIEVSEPPVKEVPKVDEPVSIDIPVTGGSLTGLYLALILVLAGMFAAYKLRE